MRSIGFGRRLCGDVRLFSSKPPQMPRDSKPPQIPPDGEILPRTHRVRTEEEQASRKTNPFAEKVQDRYRPKGGDVLLMVVASLMLAMSFKVRSACFTLAFFSRFVLLRRRDIMAKRWNARSVTRLKEKKSPSGSGGAAKTTGLAALFVGENLCVTRKKIIIVFSDFIVRTSSEAVYHSVCICCSTGPARTFGIFFCLFDILQKERIARVRIEIDAVESSVGEALRSRAVVEAEKSGSSEAKKFLEENAGAVWIEEAVKSAMAR
jgi:hypothetical protein